MSRGLGKIEQAILDRVNSIDRFTGKPSTVRVSSWHVLGDVFRTNLEGAFEPNNAQRKAVIRALHSFVRKSNRYALAGGKGRKQLYLYEPGDPLSSIWTKMSIESPEFICCTDARNALAKMQA